MAKRKGPKRCCHCDWLKWIEQASGRKRYYCQWRLQIARTTSGGKDEDSYVRYRDPACNDYSNVDERLSDL